MTTNGAYLLPGERRAGVVLVYDGYRYQRNKIVAGRKIYWRCTDQHCRVPLHTNDFGAENKIIVLDIKQKPEHKHPRENERLDRFQFIQEIKTVIGRDPSLPVRKAYEEVFLRLPHDQQNGAPHFDEVKSSLQRVRAAIRPLPPQTIDGVDIHSTWAETWDGKRQLLAIDHAVGVAVFASRRELEVLQQCSEIFVDGTFCITPAPYTHMVILYGRYHGVILPLSINLVTGKSEKQCRYVLHAIKREILLIRQRPFSPDLVITDFEVGLINAIGKELPHAESRVCQSRWRKLTELDLEDTYLRDADLQRVIGRILQMSYLTNPQSACNFKTYTNERRVRRAVQQYPPLQQFFNHVEQTYIREPEPHVPPLDALNHSQENPQLDGGLDEQMDKMVQNGRESRRDRTNPRTEKSSSDGVVGRRTWRNTERKAKRLHRACQRLPLSRHKGQDRGHDATE